MPTYTDPTINALPTYTTSELHTRTGAVLHAVATHQAAALTRHRWPLFVLMTAERYRQLAKPTNTVIDPIELLALIRQLTDCATRAAQTNDPAHAQIAREHGRHLYAELAQRIGAPDAIGPTPF